MEIDERKKAGDTILNLLYSANFKGEGGVGLLDFRDHSGIGQTEFDKIIDEMESKGMIRSYAMGYCYEIAPAGILHAEDKNLIPEEVIKRNRNARTKIMDELAKAYDKDGKFGSVHFQTISENASIESNIIVHNLILLEELDYAQPVASGLSRISDRGLDAVKEHRKRVAIANSFEEISKMKPQPRGIKLQDLVADIAEQQGWKKEVSVRTSNEELDVVIYRCLDFFIVECKWEQKPIEAKDLRDFYAKLVGRDGVKGIFVSMSGFTSGAEEVVLSSMGQRAILLFGEGDINSLVYENNVFEELINEKYKQLMTKKTILVK